MSNVLLLLVFCFSVFTHPVFITPAFAKDNLEAKFKYKCASEHLIVYGSPNSARSVDNYLEAFLTFLDANFYKVPSNLKLSVFVFPTRSEFDSYVRTNLGINDSIFGVYIGSSKFLTYADSGLGTMSHEFMHAIFDVTGAKLDHWAREGVPAFFEKMFGYKEKGKVDFVTGFHNPWRITAIQNRLSKLTLKEIIKDKESGDQSEERLVAIFLYKQGKLKKFLELSKTGNKGNFDTCLEAAFGQKAEKLEPLWKAYTASINRQRRAIAKIPGSRFYQSKAAFDKFMSGDGKILSTFTQTSNQDMH
jgi:hypothetical protein